MSRVVVRELVVKVSSIALVLLAGMMLTYFLDLRWGLQAAGECILLLMLVGFWSLTRIFRGPAESDASRPLWRLTERPLWGYILGVFFVTVGASNFLIGFALMNIFQMLAYAVMVLLGVLFFFSSIKLNRRG